MSIPEVMIIMPIYAITAAYHIRGRILLMVLYILLRVPFTTTYLLNFFASLSRSYEEQQPLITACKGILEDHVSADPASHRDSNDL